MPIACGPQLEISLFRQNVFRGRYVGCVIYVIREVRNGHALQPTQLQMSSGHVSLDLLRLRIQKMGRCPQDIVPAKIPCEGYLLY